MSWVQIPSPTPTARCTVRRDPLQNVPKTSFTLLGRAFYVQSLFDGDWKSDHLLDFDDVLIDPFKDLSESEFSTGDRSHHEFESRDRIDGQVESADKKKRVRGCKGYALVSVEKRVIVRQGFEEGRRFLSDTVVVTSLRAKYRGFQQTAVSNATDPTVLIDLLLVDCEDFGNGEVDTLWHLAHFASF